MPKCKYCNEPIKWKYLWGKTPTGEKNIPFNIDGSEHNLSCEVILRRRAEEPFNTMTGKPLNEEPKTAGIKTMDQTTRFVTYLGVLEKNQQLILKKLDELAEMM